MDYSDGGGGFYLTSKTDTDLLVRPRGDHDEANPSGASQLLEALIKFAHITGEENYLQQAEALALNQQAVAKTNQGNMAGFMNGLHSWFNHRHVLIQASNKKSATGLLKTATRNSLVAKTITLKTAKTKKSQFGQKLPSHQSNTTAIVCSGQMCSAPVETSEELDVLLNDA